MAGIGKLFKFGGKKPPEPPRKDYDERQGSCDGDSDEDLGYIDPTTIHSALPSSSGSLSSKMPNYPPPRPNHSVAPSSHSLDRSRKGPPENVCKPTAKPRTVHTARHAEGQAGSQAIKCYQPGPAVDWINGNFSKKAADDYCDPWDAKNQHKSTSSGDDYCDPVDVSRPAKEKLDNYCDPWDSRQGHIAKPRVNTTGVKDEYIDPWDAQGPSPGSIQQSSKHDSDEDSYTEPYDTGKITVLDEQAKKMSLRGMRLPSTGSEQGFNEHLKRPQTQIEDNRPTDDYESPWESRGLIKPTPTPQTCPTQMPTQDSRPCDDYDKPWEWTKKRPASPFSDASKLAFQAPKVDSRPADDYDAPWEYNKRTSQLLMASQPKTDIPVKPPRTMPVSIKGLAIDTTKPLEKHQWYHGPLSRVEAECLLKYEEDCSFLVRDSESSRKDYSLSLKNSKTFMHLKIVRNTDDRFVLGQFSQPFDNVPEVIEHYSHTKLNIKGAEHKYLKNPIFPKHDYFVLEKS